MGVSFPVLKGIMTVMSPLTLMLVRGLVSSVVLAVILRRTGGWRLPSAEDLPAILAAGLVGFTLSQILYSWGLHLTTGSHSGRILTVTPLFVFGMSQALGHVRLGRRDVLGLALGVGGALLIIGWPASGAAGGASVLGDLLTVGAAITWGVWTILAARILRRRSILAGTLLDHPDGDARAGALRSDRSRDPRLGDAVVGVRRHPLHGNGRRRPGSLLWYAAVRRLGAARTAIYANMELFFAVLVAALLLGEQVAGVVPTRRPE
jgi:drug/metabolite transporter (DMT)-like permease